MADNTRLRVEVVTITATHLHDRAEAIYAARASLDEHAVASLSSTPGVLDVEFAYDVEVQPLLEAAAAAARQWAPCDLIARDGRRVVATA